MKDSRKKFIYKTLGLSLTLYIIWMMVVFDLLAVPGAKTAHFIEELIGGSISLMVAFIAYSLFQKTVPRRYLWVQSVEGGAWRQ